MCCFFEKIKIGREAFHRNLANFDQRRGIWHIARSSFLTTERDG